MFIVRLVFALMVAGSLGFGISMILFANILNKSNNIGDSKGDRNLYTAGIEFTARNDKLKFQGSLSAPYDYCKSHTPLNFLKQQQGGQTEAINSAMDVQMPVDGAANSAFQAAMQAKRAEIERVQGQNVMYSDPNAPVQRYMGGVPAKQAIRPTNSAGGVAAGMTGAANPPSQALQNTVHPQEDAPLSDWAATRQKAKAESQQVFNQPSINDEIDAWFEDNQNK